MRSVYLMKASNDLYKVGVATNVDKRLKALQTSNGRKILVVTHARTANALKLEKQIHKMLDNYKQPGGREWFELTTEQALKVCIYIHQNSQEYQDEDEIKDLVSEYSEMHSKLVELKHDLDVTTTAMGSNITNALHQLRKYKTIPKPIKIIEKQKSIALPENEMIANCKEYVIRVQKASTSSLQREFKIGYGRAARIMNDLESQGIIGPADGSRPRQVLVRDKAVVDAANRVLARM